MLLLMLTGYTKSSHEKNEGSNKKGYDNDVILKLMLFDLIASSKC